MRTSKTTHSESMIVLPYDVWLNISTFLPSDALWKLRGLNRAFYDIAMDIRYKRVEIPMRFTKIKGYSRDFLRFRDGVAKRVQEIAYYPSAKTVFPPKKEPKMVQKLSALIQRLDSIGVGDQVLMKETIQAFTDLKSLSIQFSRIEEQTLQECIPLFHTNFRVSSGIRKLELSLPHNKISAILPSDLYLPYLDTLSLVFSTSTDVAEPDYQPSFKDTANYTVTPFVNTHRKTLVSVDFRIYGFTETWPPMITVFAISHLFQEIKHIIHLRSITVCLSQSDSFKSVAHFIRDHSETIQTLRIYFVDGCLSPDKLFDHIGERPFPNLSALAIPECKEACPLQDHDSRSGTTATFIQRCSSSLTSLNFLHTKHSRDSISHLLNPAVATPFSFSAMTFLHIRLCFFTVDLMELFVDRLPSLHELDLVIDKLLDEDIMLLNDKMDDEFRLEMSRHDYSHWNLKHFNIVITEGRYTLRRPSDEAGALLVRALPSLITFCRVKRASNLVSHHGDNYRCIDLNLDTSRTNIV